MEHHYETKDNVLIIYLKGDLIGENNGPELVRIVNDSIHDKIIHCAVDLSRITSYNVCYTKLLRLFYCC